MKQLYVVGIGPGEIDKMTIEARGVLDECEVIAGYRTYVELVREYYPDRQYIVNGMRGEVERCELALKAAAQGRTTAMICSGDAGVYGMAGIILEMGKKYADVRISVVAGVTAALSGGAVLGAPLGHDFAVISLSDLLTPWESIERRLRAVSAADMAICIYNPASHTRSGYLKRACDIIMENQSELTVCGYVRNIGREGQSRVITTLGDLKDASVDMFTTVYIGNSRTMKIGERMVTPRGYRYD